MRRREPEDHQDNADRWVVSYADFITLLFAFFTVMYAVSRVDSGKLNLFVGSTRGAFGSNPPASMRPIIPGIVPIPPTAVGLQREAARILAAAGAEAAVTVRQDPRGLVLSIGENVLFGAGTAAVKPSSSASLAAVATVLKKGQCDAVVEGHTDSLPISNARYASNWELSATRATNILERLVVEYGISPGRLSAAGYAEFRPVASNTNPEGRARNRRVDVVLLLSGTGSGGTR
ncbi:MAG: OmpA family protein [bacterium]